MKLQIGKGAVDQPHGTKVRHDHAIKPLNLLLKQAQRIEEGHYEEPIPLLHRQDAVGRLQNSFHVMQESLERHLSDIQQKNEQAAHHNEQLMQASQLAEKSAQQKVTFIQNMTHQVRTPLNIIMGFGQVLRDSIKLLPAEEVKDMTAIMYHNAHSLNRMLLMLYDSSDVGTTAELENLNCEDVPCNKMVRESISTTQEHYEDAHFNFETSVDDSLCIWSNYLYALRSIRELLYNAAKYSDRKNASVSSTVRAASLLDGYSRRIRFASRQSSAARMIMALASSSQANISSSRWESFSWKVSKPGKNSAPQKRSSGPANPGPRAPYGGIQGNTPGCSPALRSRRKPGESGS